MGREVLQAILGSEDLELVAAIDPSYAGKAVSELIGGSESLVVSEAVAEVLSGTRVDVLVDFSVHSMARHHALHAVECGVSPVIGVTGMDEAAQSAIEEASREREVPGLYAPNFSIGAVLMMQFAESAARWMPHCEVIELHHDGKEDSPSGTAMLTASRVARGRSETVKPKSSTFERVPGARGATHEGVVIHSVRLPGLVAHQKVLFGGIGEVLTIQHDSNDRKSFMEGVKLACREVRQLDGFKVGLEHLLMRDR
jgi:4-hydroxy-tetrahydrodipicolinate reductase